VTSTGAASYVLGHDEPTIPATSAYAAPAPTQPAETPTHELVLQPLDQPVYSTPLPADLGLPMPPPLPDFSAPSVMASAYAPQASPQPEILGDILAPEPPAAPFAPQPPAPTPPVTPPTPNDPGQFHIPGQQ